ncbi:hypothetical protein LIER_34797 [Lithospermum erythrorhizon]|uniref:Reverse transcriptase n=1 Tax=Lithospermum erythrorhizon TaxID=34254 RepID=A0AAV3S1A1_LITER
MLREAEERKGLSRIKISRESPSINHILFSDGTMIFCKASRSEGGRDYVHIGSLRRGVGAEGKLMSQAVKEVMVKSVTLAIPIFVMNCFKLPYGITDNLNNSMAKFYWGNMEGGRVSIGSRGVSFVRKRVRVDFVLRILNKEPWVPRDSDCFLHGERADKLRWVSQLMQGGECNKEAMETVVEGEDVHRVLAIPLSRRGVEDRLIWSHTRCGNYLTCSGYKCARKMKRDGELRGKV